MTVTSMSRRSHTKTKKRDEKRFLFFFLRIGITLKFLNKTDQFLLIFFSKGPTIRRFTNVNLNRNRTTRSVRTSVSEFRKRARTEDRNENKPPNHILCCSPCLKLVSSTVKSPLPTHYSFVWTRLSSFL